MAVKLNQNFRMYRGNSLDLSYTVTDENSSAFDLTGAKIRWRMANNQYSTASLVSKSSTVGSSEAESTNSTAGSAKIHLKPSDTNTLQAKVYYHELEIVDSAGNTYTVAIGSATLERTLI